MTEDVIQLDEDDSVERQLFALRATALPAPALDIGDVVARVRRREHERAARARIVAWMGAAACAAASMVLAVSDVHRVDARTGDAVVTNDEAALMCDRNMASRAPREDLQSHDDTNVCVGP